MEMNSLNVERALAAQTHTIDELLTALRRPASFLGESTASPNLLAEFEEGDWSSAHEEINAILAAHGETPDIAFRVLNAAARFLRSHGLRLHGNPWLHMLCFEGVAGISYVLHLDLDREDANTWNDRFYDALANGDLLNSVFSLNLRHRGPVR
ncbi:MAG: hypothetical protein EOP37_18700 [Rubrivivax sp.]|nr:MAG: hypothetical protein EOP37_18700 [Rubrivivax sp.]